MNSAITDSNVENLPKLTLSPKVIAQMKQYRIALIIAVTLFLPIIFLFATEHLGHFREQLPRSLQGNVIMRVAILYSIYFPSLLIIFKLSERKK